MKYAKKVDMDRVDKVVEAMKSFPKDQLIVTGLNQRLTVSKYSLEYFLYEKNLYSDKDHERLDEYVMFCPFHAERTPSFSVNMSKGACNCLSCGKGGGYLKFVGMYTKFVEGIDGSHYDILNNTLRLDPVLQAVSGVSTIFIEDDLIDMKTFSFGKIKLEKTVTPSNYLEMQSYLKRKGKTSEREILQFAYLVQTGTPVKDIYDLMIEGKQVAYGQDTSINSISEDITVILDLDLDFDID